MENIGALILLALAVLLYCLPMIVAGKRHHHNAMPIFIVNLLLGWTLLGWVFALAWAASAIKKPQAGQKPIDKAASAGPYSPWEGGGPK